MLRRRDIRIEGLRRAEGPGGPRVVADVAGAPVWFETGSDDAAAAPEALLGPFLLPALERRARLLLEGEVDATWLGNAREATALLRRWWGHRGPDPLERLAPAAAPRERRAEGAQCFTGGIDSFFTLRRSPHRRDVLLFVEGYDVDLADEARLAAIRRSVREVAAATGRRAAFVRTNLREHPLFRESRWIRTHGAALAAAGHVLAGSLGTLVIPASWSRAYPGGWGSHWALDPLWSSSALAVVHDDASLERWDKPPFLRDDGLMAEHLRVCWENRTQALNCGLCEKCLRTRLVLLHWGMLDALAPRFETRLPLAASLDLLPSLGRLEVEEVWSPFYVPWDDDPAVGAAVRRLVDRSRRPR